MSDRPVLLRPDLASGSGPGRRRLRIEGADQHHLCRVLRLRIEVCSGRLIPRQQNTPH